MSKSLKLSKILAKYGKEELWIALSENKEEVVGKGKTLKDALEEARSNNTDNPIVIKAIPDYSKFILHRNVRI